MTYDRAKIIAQMNAATDKNEKTKLQSDAIQQWSLEFAQTNGRPPTPMEQAVEWGRIAAEMSPTAENRQQAQNLKDQASKVRLDAVQNQVDQALALMAQGGLSGIPGMANLIKEIVGPWVGVDTGGSPAHQLDTLMALIQTGAEAELASPGARSNIQFRDNVAKLAQFIRPGADR